MFISIIVSVWLDIETSLISLYGHQIPKKELKRLKRPILQCEGYVNCHDVEERISWLWTTIKRCKMMTIAKIARNYDTQMYATR